VQRSYVMVWGGTLLEEVGYCGHTLEGILGSQLLSSLSPSWPLWEEHSFAPHCDVLPLHKPKNKTANHPGTEISETRSQNKSLLFISLFCQVSYYSGRNLSKTLYFKTRSHPEIHIDMNLAGDWGSNIQYSIIPVTKDIRSRLLLTHPLSELISPPTLCHHLFHKPSISPFHRISHWSIALLTSHDLFLASRR
jgi:hypothetical protein